MSSKRTIHVFIASPGDLAVERRAFKEVIDELNAGFGDGAGVEFVGLGWEDMLASTGPRVQDVINRDIDRSDVFVLALNRRWGQEAPDAKPFTSYTEEEYHRARDRWERTGSPKIFVFFKHVDAASMGDPGKQLKKVLAFRKSLENSRQVFYKFFADDKDAPSLNVKTFIELVHQHLRAYAKGEIPKPDAPREPVPLPPEHIRQVEQAKVEAQRAAERAKREHQRADEANAWADELALELAEQAAKAALNGRVEEATQTFAKAHQGTTNLRVLSLAYQFYNRTGDLTTAEELLKRWLAISGKDAQTAETAGALGNLGLIYWRRAELERAEEMHRKSLAINEKLGQEEGMAFQYGNLGLIYRIRGELKQAEEMYQKSLAIFEKLDHQEGMANTYGNLGVVYQIRSELDRAEEMHKKSLAINEKLGRKESMAGECGNLGLIYRKRGALDRSEVMSKMALEIFDKLGQQEGMASAYGNLGLIYLDRGELDRAEDIFQKSLGIQDKLGLAEGMANQYLNLGSVAKARGDLDRARELWTKARDLYAKFGMSHNVKGAQGLLDGLP